MGRNIEMRPIDFVPDQLTVYGHDGNIIWQGEGEAVNSPIPGMMFVMARTDIPGSSEAYPRPVNRLYFPLSSVSWVEHRPGMQVLADMQKAKPPVR